MTLAQITIPGTTFELPLEVLVLGLVTCLTYSLLGMGLTLVNKSARVLNFAMVLPGGGYGPAQDAVLSWGGVCRCWSETRPYRDRTER